MITTEIKLREEFDKLFSKEDPWKQTSSCFHKSYLERIKTILKQKKYLNAIAIRSGEGDITEALSNFVVNILGVDISSVAIERAKNNNKHHNVSYISAGALDYTLKSNDKYDLVLCLEMLYYLNDDEQIQLLNNISKILLPKGVLLLGVVVSGANQYKEYFTYNKIHTILQNIFIIKSSCTVTPNYLRVYHKVLLKILCSLHLYKMVSEFIKLFFDSKTNAYQTLFVLEKK